MNVAISIITRPSRPSGHHYAARASTLLRGISAWPCCISYSSIKFYDDVHDVRDGSSINRYYSTSTPILMSGGPITKEHQARKKKIDRDIDTDGSSQKNRQSYQKIQQLKRKIKNLSVESQANPKKNEKQQKRQPHRQQPTQTKPLQGPFSAFISCLPGLEPILLQEVTYLQSQWQEVSSEEKKMAKAVPGGVKIIVPKLVHLYVLHLYLGTASHIYLRLNDDHADTVGSIDIPPLFRARGFPELKRKLKDLILSQQWEDRLFMMMEGNNNGAGSLPLWQLQVHVTTSKSKLMHTKAVEERVRETIGDVLGINEFKSRDDNTTMSREDTDKRSSRPIVRFLVRIERDVVQISLDASSSSSATPLHMRGYRLDPFKAPLREDLSFALLMAGGLKPTWDLEPLHSLLNPDRVGAVDKDPDITSVPKDFAASVQLFDPLCGSGTIAIEGASILAGLPPGRFRPPPFQGTKLCDPNLWDAIKSKALSVSLTNHRTNKDDDINDERNDNATILVAANDINKNAISAATSNAKRAGVDRFIKFTVGPFKHHPLLNNSTTSDEAIIFELSQSKPLLLITNPPYGKRLSTSEQHSTIYKQIANAITLSSQNNLRCTIIGKDPRSMRESSLPLEVVFSTKQGGLNVVAMTGAAINNNGEVK